MAKFVWQDGTLVSKAKVEVGGTIYEVVPEEYSGTTPLSASNLNTMVDSIYSDHAIDSGSNANGNYVKFADGTMICYGTDSVTATINTAWGNIYRSTTLVNATYPIAFTTTPSFEITMKAGNSAWLINYQASSNDKTASDSYTLSRPESKSSTTYQIQWIAIGKWK